MKDAFGGAFLIKVMMVFLVVFISFMTVAITFTKVFNVKNNVINILEHSSGETEHETTEKIEKYLSDVAYVYIDNDAIMSDCSNQRKEITSSKKGFGHINGVCVVPIGNDDYTYYKVTAYIVLDFPLFRFGTALPISGESVSIVNNS